MVTCTIDGERVPMDRVHVRVMNFGQHWRTEGIVEATYRLRIPLACVLTFLERTLPERVADARAFPDDRDSFEHELARREWPDAGTIVSDERLLLLLVETLGYDFLLHAVDKEASVDDFVLNSVDMRRVDSAHVVLEGRCRRPAERVGFQDV